jgi:hypothetical protein
MAQFKPLQKLLTRRRMTYSGQMVPDTVEQLLSDLVDREPEFGALSRGESVATHRNT